MQREGGFGREETGRFAPGEEKLSTEDIARTDKEPTPSAGPAEPMAPSTPSAPAADEEPMPPRDEEMPETPMEEPPERVGEPPGPVAAHDQPQAQEQSQAQEATPAGEEGAVPLLDSGAAEDLRSRWTDIQQGFVDDPQAAVRAADELVVEVMQLLAATFAEHKEGLESQWHRGDEVATEDLRVALRQYRSFFDRLLTT
ncbi:hypothetical protein ACIQ7Q_25185 [Streptomyces sp. NPDC096176]|uniref:hypothetical protein n=1 Tax=Streptomyces sp. NPDC096176 TaxID=3366079 RepID=UPI0037FF912C